MFRSLTGIALVDVLWLAGIGALVAHAAIRRDTTVRVVSTLAFVVVATDIGTSAPAALFTGMAIAAVGRILLTDRLAVRTAAYALGACAAALLLAGVAALTVRDDANAASTRLHSLRDDLTADDTTLASRNLAVTDAQLARVDARLNNIVTQPARLVPFAGKQLDSARDLVAAVRSVVGTARGSIDGVNPHDLKLQHGRVPVARIAALREPALDMQRAARRALSQARATREGFLLPPLNRVADDVVREADDTQRSAGLIASLAAHAPDLFGNNGLRRYFLLVQNPAEARPMGGILGAYAEVTADHGQLALAAVGRDSTLNDLSGDRPRPDTPGFARARRVQPTRYWQNMTASPDFVTVAQEVEREYAPIAHPVDGVISIDPPALAAMLKVIGPVNVADWPVPLDANNVVQVLEHDQYVRFAAVADYPKREAFMANAIATIWQHLTSASDFSLNDGLDALGAAVDDGHIAMHAVRAGEQSLFTRSGIAGAFPSTLPVDVLAVTSYNVGANKLDWFTSRHVTYQPKVDNGELTATVTISLRNDTPPGEPTYVAGGADPKITRDNNPQYVSVYTKLNLAGVFIDRQKTTAVIDTDLGVNVYSVRVDLPPGAPRIIAMRLKGRWREDADYELAYRPQPLVHGDDLVVLYRETQVPTALTPKTYDRTHVRWYRVRT